MNVKSVEGMSLADIGRRSLAAAVKQVARNSDDVDSPAPEQKKPVSKKAAKSKTKSKKAKMPQPFRTSKKARTSMSSADVTPTSIDAAAAFVARAFGISVASPEERASAHFDALSDRSADNLDFLDEQERIFVQLAVHEDAPEIVIPAAKQKLATSHLTGVPAVDTSTLDPMRLESLRKAGLLP